MEASLAAEKGNLPAPRARYHYRQMRLRTHKDRLKIEHSIIGGLREVLEQLLREHPSVQSIIPGRIRPVRDAKGTVVKIGITTPTQTGWKGIALASGARQESSSIPS